MVVLLYKLFCGKTIDSKWILLPREKLKTARKTNKCRELKKQKVR